MKVIINNVIVIYLIRLSILYSLSSSIEDFRIITQGDVFGHGYQIWTPPLYIG